MKIKYVKFANAVHVGNEAVTYVTSEHYTIELENNLFIRLAKRHRPHEICITSVMNMIYCVPEQGEEPTHEVVRRRARPVSI